MKKFGFILFAIVCVLSSCAKRAHTYASEWSSDDQRHWKRCEEVGCNSVIASAKHSFSQTEKAEGWTVYVCTVCGYEKKATSNSVSHSHSFSETYTSNASQHWKICSECAASSEKEAHIWGESVILKPSTSDSEGSAEHVCTVCGKYLVFSLEKLSEKMSEEEWKAAFEFENVRIRESMKSGSLVTVQNTLYSVDGELVSVLSGDNTTYTTREALERLNLSEYYSGFSHYGNNVYKAEEVNMSLADGTASKLSNITVSFKNGHISGISYSISVGNLFGSFFYIYDFYDFDTVTLSPRRLTSEEVTHILNTKSFSSDFQLIYNKITATGSSYEADLSVTCGEYTCKYYTDGRFLRIQKGSSAAVAGKISEFLASILASTHITPESFVYESDYKTFVFVGKPFEVAGLDVINNIEFITNDDGTLSSLYLNAKNGTVYSLTFVYN